MDKSAMWKRFTKYYRFYEELGVGLDVSRISFPDTFIAEHQSHIDSALDEMEALEKGAIANADEGRMVGHYWLRDSALAPSPEIKSEIDLSVDRVRAFAKSVIQGSQLSRDGVRFTQAVIIGIGGSALGPQLLYDAFGAGCVGSLQLFFCDNTDPDGINRLLNQLSSKLGETLFVVISKSGGTVETRNGMLEIIDYCKQRSVDFSARSVAITCANSKLDQLARNEQWLDRFYIWDWVGGRTSLFSAVGLLPAALQGLDTEQFLNGARLMDRITRERSILENPAAMLALMWFYAGDGVGRKDMVVLPYKDRLLLFSRYLQQLIMESLGKREDRAGFEVFQGLSVYGNKGSTDQHAYIQQLRDGLKNFFVNFIEVLSDGTNLTHLEVEPGVTSGDYLEGFYLGTREALSASGRESLTITIRSLNESTIGGLIALFERTVGLYASMVNINAYHQPGVEAGKKAASIVIALQLRVVKFLLANAGKSYSVEQIALEVQQPDECETIYKVLEHLCANPDRKLVRETGSTPTSARYCCSC